jgi:crossover junction endodeoxyribonuclease RuvC
MFAPRLPALRVLGVDPGLVRTGWAVLDSDGQRTRVVAHGVIAPPTDAELPARLAAGAAELRHILREYQPRLAALEEVFTAPRHPRSALLMAHMRGVICLTLQEADVPILPLTATTVKQRLSGSGHASKQQVQRMVQHMTGVEPGSGMRLDESDAIALALAALSLSAGPAAAAPARRRTRGLPEHLLARGWSPRV